jgi:hypothetical protein
MSRRRYDKMGEWKFWHWGSTVIGQRSVLTDRLSWGYGKTKKLACAYGFRPSTGRHKGPADGLSSTDSRC